MKTYLVFALVLLMFITSMGIFGFLSKAHIEQTAASTESVVQVKRIVTEIARLSGNIERSEEKIIKAENSGGKANASVQAQIDTEHIVVYSQLLKNKMPLLKVLETTTAPKWNHI
jgi:hypothetical protein